MNQPLDVDAAVRYTELEFLTGYPPFLSLLPIQQT